MSRNRDVAALRMELEGAGLTVRLARSGHWRVETPGGGFVATIPSTPSCPRALDNCRSHIRRRLREMRHPDSHPTATQR